MEIQVQIKDNFKHNQVEDNQFQLVLKGLIVVILILIQNLRIYLIKKIQIFLILILELQELKISHFIIMIKMEL